MIDHIAFGSRGFESMQQHLTQKGVTFRVNEVPNSSRRQIFVQDPNNVLIELNFDVADETARWFQADRDRRLRRRARVAAIRLGHLLANEAGQRKSRDVHFRRPIPGREAAGVLVAAGDRADRGSSHLGLSVAQPMAIWPPT